MTTRFTREELKSFGTYLQDTIIQHNTTRAHVCRWTGIAEQKMYDYVKGNRPPTRHHLLALAEFFKDDLFLINSFKKLYTELSVYKLINSGGTYDKR